MNLIFAGVAAHIILINQGHILRHAPLKLCLDLNERTVAILVEGGQTVNVERDAFDHAYEEGVLEERDPTAFVVLARFELFSSPLYFILPNHSDFLHLDHIIDEFLLDFCIGSQADQIDEQLS